MLLGATIAVPARVAHPVAIKVPVCGSAGSTDALPRLLEGLGDHRFGPSAPDPLVRRWFEQGLMLTWGFDFAAGQRAFREAVARDPDCAICWWGLAYALGPSVNHDIDAATAAQARVAVQRAVAAAGHATARERALIAAMSTRYPDAGKSPSTEGVAPVDDQRYAEAMAAVARQFPRDADVLVLHADALMTPRGRAYWRKDGRPEPWTREVLHVVERALVLDPRHPGAAHLHIHALEDAPSPARAQRSADLLRTAAPGVPHLVHMPSHIDARVGRLDAAVDVNRRAIALDAARADLAAPDPDYQRGYADHNVHFLWHAAIAAGREADAREAAERLAQRAANAATPDGTLQHWAMLPAFTALRFGRWQEAIAMRAAVDTPYTAAMTHFVRGVARAATGDAAGAAVEARGLAKAARDAEGRLAGVRIKNTHAVSDLVALADAWLGAEVARVQGRGDEAVAMAREAVAREEALDFDEPPVWHVPARRLLGDVLMAAGRTREGAATYRAELRRRPGTVEVVRALARTAG